MENCYHSSNKRDELRHRFSELQAVIIDEVSMVNQNSLEHINQHLNEIFGTAHDVFGGLMVILVGDLLQLPPVRGSRVFQENQLNPLLNIDMLWHYFQMIELTEVVRQKDPVFIKLLNNCRIGEVTDDDIAILQSRHVDNFLPYPKDIIHLYAENASVAKHNDDMLKKLHTQSYTIPAVDKLPPGVLSIRSLIYNKTQMELSGLATSFNIRLGAVCMITQNIDIEDRLINGSIGTVAHIKCHDGKPFVIYMKFSDERAGQNVKRTDSFARLHDYVPIKKVESEVSIRSFRGANIRFRRKQFPLMLSYAATIHKVQGQQFPKALLVLNYLNRSNSDLGSYMLH